LNGVKPPLLIIHLLSNIQICNMNSCLRFEFNINELKFYISSKFDQID